MIEILCPTEADTRAVARKLAALLNPGDVVLLVGVLGSGKTLFAGGLGAGLGVDEDVLSPSFLLVRVYRTGFMTMVHADAYRLNSMNEFDDLNLFEMARGGVLVIEWGDAVEAGIPDEHLRVDFDVAADGARSLRFTPHGSWVGRDLATIG
jgi:tRNA threonylcarbamoyladenosine biosynthesis protein TsaE